MEFSESLSYLLGLGHETLDDPMEHDTVVKSFAHQFLDPRDVTGAGACPVP